MAGYEGGERMEEKNNTKSKLIRAGIRLFSQYGYAGTSTRMIASEAGVNLSAIAFHYTNKECLYAACLEYLLEKIREYYSPSYSRIEECFRRGEMTRENARKFLLELIDIQIETAFEKRYRTTLAMIYREEGGPDSRKILTEEVFNRQEGVMASLLQVLAPVDEAKARVMSRFINGGIIAFGEHKGLIAPYIDIPENGVVPEWVRQEIRRSCMWAIDGFSKAETGEERTDSSQNCEK